jgi:hypothetical protein
MFDFHTKNIELDIISPCPEMVKAIPMHLLKDFSVYRQTVDISWQIEFEMRTWGIKETYITVPPQWIEFEVEIETENEPLVYTIKVMLDQVHGKFRDAPTGGLIPTRLEYYHKTGWTLEF